jgi:signal transduction histidine kinase
MTVIEGASIIISPLGTLFYEALLMVCLFLFLGFIQLAKLGDSESRTRWNLIAGTLLGVYLILFILELFTVFGLINGDLLIPPFNRFASLAGCMLFAWGLLYPHANRKADRVLLVLMLVAIFLTAGMVLTVDINDPDVFLNRSNWDAAWSISGLLITIAGALALAFQRPGGWTFGFPAYCLLFIGYLLHMTLGPSESSLAAFTRWAEILAYPLLLTAGVKALRPEPAAAAPQKPVDRASMITYETEYFSLPAVLMDLANMLSSNDIESLVPSTVRGVAQIMKSEICILLTPPEPPEHLSMAMGFDLISERYIEGKAIDPQEFPVIVNSLKHKRSLILPAQTRAPDIAALRHTLGLNHTGPVLLAPMVSEKKLQGAIMLLSPFARRRWSEGSRDSLELIGRIVADRFRELNTSSTTLIEPPSSIEDDLHEAREQLETLQRENARLLDQISMISGTEGYDLDALLEAQRDSESTIKALENEVERLKAVVSEQPSSIETDQVDHLANQLQIVLQELAEARAKLSAMEHLQAAPMIPEEQSADVKAITSISHDLRQPLSSIRAYTELLLEDPVDNLSDQQQDYMEHLNENAVLMTSLLNDLINITAIEMGTLDLHPAPVNLIKRMDDAITQTSLGLRRKNLSIKMDFPDDVPTVKGDEDALLQVLVHLLNNAIAVSPEEGEIKISARIAATNKNNFLTLTVSDQGGGIPPEDLGRVFEPVYKTGGVTIIGVGETGMGLSIVRSLMEAMGGRVWVDSHLGSGSTFTVLIPLAD